MHSRRSNMSNIESHTKEKNTVYLVQGESQGEWHIILAKYKDFNLKVHHKQ